ncbi:MAG TPA: hypothetical protein PKE32_05540 [Miltoncostaeaceae bacterium]|nr:hypothetical protein [Miltoncostaeaceae bacterium]
MTRFSFARGRWTPVLLGPFGASRPTLTLDGDALRVRMGVLGGGSIPLEHIAAVGTMRWPWWGGLGVRITRGLTTFAARSGPAVVLELNEPVSLRTPLPWKARRVALVVADREGFIQALLDAGAGAIQRLPGGI